MQQPIELLPEAFVALGLIEGGLQLGNCRHEGLGDELPAEAPEAPLLRHGRLSFSATPPRIGPRADRSARMIGAGSSAVISAVPTRIALTRAGSRRTSSAL